MSAATQNVNTRPAAIGVDTGQSRFTPVLVIDRFDHWHNQPDSLLSPTSICWTNSVAVDPTAVAGRAA